MRVRHRFGFCLVLLALAGPSLAAVAGCDDLRGGEIRFRVDWQDQVKPILNTLLGGRCSGCHFEGQFPDFTDAGVDAIYKLVGSYAIPGQPLRSGLFDKVNCASPYAGARMPLGGAALTLEQQSLIYDWIAQGAYGEPGMPIARAYIFRDGVESRRWY